MNGLKFQKALGDLIDTEIGLYLNDSEFVEGFLLDVKPDHIVVDVNKTAFYFALQHIQTISSNTKNFLVSTEIVHYLNKNYLEDVLKALRYYWVSINSLSDQGHFGVLSKIADDYVTVINNTELFHIRKSSISNITSHIPEKRIILINTQEQLALQASQIVEQTIGEHKRMSKIEVPILEISAGEVAEDDNIANERPGVHPQTRLELYFTLVKLLKHNLSNRDVDNERAKDIIQDLASHKEDEIIEEITNVEVSILKASAEEKTELEKAPQETPEDSSWFSKSGLLECDKECSLEANHLGGLESNNRFSLPGQFIPTQSKAKRKKKLLTARGNLNNEQNSITKSKNQTVANELPDYEVVTIKLEGSSDSDDLLVQPLGDQYPNSNFGTLDEKREFTEVTASQLPTNPKEVKKILEKQYLSLMKHAETNVFLLAQRRLNQSEEAQYLALQKHAENMYRELKT